MRILFAVPHVFNPRGGSVSASTRANPAPRIAALNSCIAGLYGNFGPRQHKLHILQRRSFPANHAGDLELTVLIVTTRGLHLLEHPDLFTGGCVQHDVDVEPMMLGFEIQSLLRDRLGDYDFYCFLEDDLTIHDPWFFAKLEWFNRLADDPVALLQPNRYETSLKHKVHKLYIDGEINPASSIRFQDVTQDPELSAQVMEKPVVFQRTTNPHSGCYFLTPAQLDHWVQQPHFLDRDCSFVGPLESAATLGIMKAFRVYKPASANADFLEIEHYGDEIMSGRRVGNRTGLGMQIG